VRDVVVDQRQEAAGQLFVGAAQGGELDWPSTNTGQVGASPVPGSEMPMFAALTRRGR
jgi:hypothetical protein